MVDPELEKYWLPVDLYVGTNPALVLLKNGLSPFAFSIELKTMRP
jgi:hypothetical protein